MRLVLENMQKKRWKLSPFAFTRFLGVHAWFSVIAGLILYVMFIAGGMTLFHEELETWEEPLAQRLPSPAKSLQASLDQGLASLQKVPTEVWFTPAREGHGEAKFDYLDPDTGLWNALRMDSEKGTLVRSHERLAHFLYEIHFLWHDLTGQWLYKLAGFLAVGLLLVLITGVLIHLKDLVRQFHQFRPEASRRLFWSDLHKVLGVMGLPFQVMYAYTGALLILGPLLLQAFTGPVFQGDVQRASHLATGYTEFAQTEPGPVAPLLSLDALEARAQELHPDFAPESIRVIHPGRSNSWVEIWGKGGSAPRERMTVRLKAQDGSVDPTLISAEREAARAARQWIYGLHVATFGGMPLRFLFLFLALAACATILTGNWIWLARREARKHHPGNRLLARLTVGVGAGAWVAFGALFLASRAFPLRWAPREVGEELAFLLGLAACIVWALRSRALESLWWKQLALAAALFLPVPLLAARWSSAGLWGAGPRLTTVVAVDLMIGLTALSLGATAWLLRRRWVTAAEKAVPAALVSREVQSA